MIRKSHLIICLVAAFLSFGSSVHAGVINLPPAMYSMGTSDYYVGDGSRLRPAPLYQDHTYSESRSVKQLDDGRVAIGRATVEAKIEQVPTVKASMSHDGGPWMGIATEPIANGYEHFDNYMVPTKAYS